MKRIFVALSRGIFNLLYEFFSLFSRKDEVLFLSRQTDEPSYDFRALGEAFSDKGYTPVFLVKKLSRKTVFSYMVHIVKEIYHLARCRVCFVDRYDPVVSLLNFTYEKEEHGSGAIHTKFPSEPVIIQLWHAFGAYKRFGYQSLDTIEGHTRDTAEAFRIHRNYSWICCTGESTREAFAEAFSYPKQRILNLGRPEYEAMRQQRRETKKRDTRVRTILFAPTLRKSGESKHPFRDLHAISASFFREIPAQMVWSFHPLEETGVARGSQHALLEDTDLVITDYSSIVYEAYLLGKPVLFYVSDIDEYRHAPGLNIDPQIIAPDITFIDKESLRSFIERFINDETVYREDELKAFVADVFDREDAEPTSEIVSFCIQLLREHRTIDGA